MAVTIEPTLIESIKTLESGLRPNEGIKKLLIEKARNELIKYNLISRNFEEKYQMSFHEFKDSELMKKPSEDIEQDYFDWEMAVTISDDMRQEIKRLGTIK